MSLTGGAAILAKLKNQRTSKHEATDELPPVVIAYASQTGTAQDIAQTLHAECSKRGIFSKVFSLNALEFETLSASKTPIIISIVSSTGDGDPPDNSQTFFKSMKKAKSRETQKKPLTGVKYTCLGLGDSNYTSFMAVPTRFKTSFDELGAKRFYECREVDEVDGLDDLVDEWIEGLWTYLMTEIFEAQPIKKSKPASETKPDDQKSQENFHVELLSDSLMDFHLNSEAVLDSVPAVPVCSISVDLFNDDKDDIERGELNSQSSLQDRYPARMVEGRKMTDDASDREVFLIVLDLEESGLQYIPGDALDLVPENDAELVDALLQRLGLNGSQRLKIKTLDGTTKEMPHIPEGFTIRDCLSKSLELSGVLKKSILNYLAHHCKDEAESRRLKFLVSKHGREAYQKLIISAKASLIDILTCFPSCQPPLTGLIEFLPPLAPRMYSVASSPLVHRNHARVTFSLAKYSTPYGERIGTATRWLKNCIEKHRFEPSSVIWIPVRVRSGGSFRLPSNLKAALLLIGPGTGVAPFVGFLEERKLLSQEWKEEIGPCWLFFGCRREKEDFLFRSELEGFKQDGTIQHFNVAFSRETKEKVYVQHLMLQHSEVLFHDIFEKDGYIFICGDGMAMAKDVHQCLLQILVRHGNLNEVEAQQKLSQKQKDLTYVKDIWS